MRVEVDQALLDREKFERVWARVSPNSVKTEPAKQSKEELVLSLLSRERALRGAYGSLADKSGDFKAMWLIKQRQCRDLGAEHFLKTGNMPKSLGTKRQVSATAGNLRRWYMMEQQVQKAYRELGMEQGEEHSRRCCRVLLEKLKKLL